MGLIAIEGLQFYSYHGYYKEEQTLGGRFSVDVYIRTDYEEAAATDNLKKTINYEEVYEVVKSEMEIPAQLIEHLCKRISESIQQRYPDIEYLKVRVIKHQPPIKGMVDRVFVETESGKK